MKIKILTVSSLALVALVVGLIPKFGNSSPALAQNSTDRFYFDTVKGIPTTFLKTANKESEFINWDSNYFVPSGYSPEKRGLEVTARLNRYFANNNEVYITHGKMNNLPVVCVAEKEGGSCTGLLYTLKPNQDGERAVDLLIRQLDRPNAASALREAPCRTYLNIQAVIDGKRNIANKVCSAS